MCFTFLSSKYSCFADELIIKQQSFNILKLHKHEPLGSFHFELYNIHDFLLASESVAIHAMQPVLCHNFNFFNYFKAYMKKCI